MGAPTKSRHKKCRICGVFFKSPLAWPVVCDKCANKLPKCGSCHIVMASEYGYMESIAMKVGKRSICWDCKDLLGKRGYLCPSENQHMSPSGKIKHIRIADEDRVVEDDLA
jgi:hypothetical protein